MTEPDRGIDTTKGSLGVISSLFSSECFCGRNNFLKDNSYIFSTAPLDCVTIPYKKPNPDSGVFEETGSLKIVSLKHDLWEKGEGNDD